MTRFGTAAATGALAGLTLIATLGFAAAAATTDERIAAGRALAEAECSECHATGMSDESPRASAPAFRDLGQRYPVEQLEEALAEGIVTGHADMPEIVWEPDQIAAFIAYLKSLQN